MVTTKKINAGQIWHDNQQFHQQLVKVRVINTVCVSATSVRMAVDDVNVNSKRGGYELEQQAIKPA